MPMQWFSIFRREPAWKREFPSVTFLGKVTLGDASFDVFRNTDQTRLQSAFVSWWRSTEGPPKDPRRYIVCCSHDADFIDCLDACGVFTVAGGIEIQLGPANKNDHRAEDMPPLITWLQRTVRGEAH